MRNRITMSGSAPMLNQLHKMAMMRKRTLIGDNELYEMMRSKQVYHVQTDLQKRLSETLQSLEHDRQLALAGILSRKLVFLKQVSKRERKRKKLVDVKKQMDEILRDADIERLSISLNQVWESNQPVVDGSGQTDGIEDNSDPHVWEKRKSTLEKHLDIPKALDISLDGSTQNLKRIEKGVDLYLASINASGKAAKSNGLWRRGIPTNTLPSVSVSPQDDKLEETSTLKLSPLLLPGVQSALNFKDERDGKLATKGKESNKDIVAHYASYGTNPPRKTFETETTEIQMKKTGLLHHKKDAKTENSHSDILQKGKSSTNKNIKNELSNDTSCENRQNPNVSQEHKDGERCQRGNQLSPLLKPSPPYLVSKPSRTVRATTNLASVRPACIRACMERTVTMVYVEDSDVETPKSSFDIDAWLAFIRQKKGYSATLKDGPLERPSDGSNATDKASCSKRNVKFALGKKKLKSLRPPCKTCRDRAMEWFKEFSKTDKKGKKHSSSKKLNPLKTEGLPNLHALSSSRLQEAGSGGYSTELPRIKREDPSQLLQRIREDSKVLQEKVHHLCNDAYWKFWSNDSLDNDA